MGLRYPGHGGLNKDADEEFEAHFTNELPKRPWVSGWVTAQPGDHQFAMPLPFRDPGGGATALRSVAFGAAFWLGHRMLPLSSRDRFAPFGVALTVCMMGAITVASLLPRGGIGDPGEADKAMHILAYGISTLPAALGKPALYLPIIFTLSISGAIIELLQPLVGRSGQLEDAAANACGVLLGVLIARFVGHWIWDRSK